MDAATNVPSQVSCKSCQVPDHLSGSRPDQSWRDQMYQNTLSPDYDQWMPNTFCLSQPKIPERHFDKTDLQQLTSEPGFVIIQYRSSCFGFMRTWLKFYLSDRYFICHIISRNFLPGSQKHAGFAFFMFQRQLFLVVFFLSIDLFPNLSVSLVYFVFSLKLCLPWYFLRKRFFALKRNDKNNYTKVCKPRRWKMDSLP